MAMKIGTLSKERSLEIANNLLEVIQAFFNDIPIYELSYSLEDDYKEKQTYVEFEWSEENKGILKRNTYNVFTREKEYTEQIVIGQNNKCRVNYKEVKKDGDELEEQEFVTRENTYNIIYKGKKYEINIYNSPEDCGYYSMLPQYDEETYLLAYVCEIRPEDGSVKQEIYFGFDNISMTFLELFGIYSINKKRFMRECGEDLLDEIQEKLKETKLKK